MKEQAITCAVKSALFDIFPMFNIEHLFIEELYQEKLESSQEVNVILGITGEIKGNLVVNFSKSGALKIASSMMGGMEVTDLDDLSTSAVCELVNMIGGTTISKIQSENPIDMSPPTLILSNGNIILINKLKTHSLVFSILDEKFIISYSIEDK